MVYLIYFENKIKSNKHIFYSNYMFDQAKAYFNQIPCKALYLLIFTRFFVSIFLCIKNKSFQHLPLLKLIIFSLISFRIILNNIYF